MLSLLIFPSSTSVIQQAGEWANPWLAEFWPLIGIGFGSFCFGLLVPWLFGIIKNAITGAFRSTEIVKTEWFDEYGHHFGSHPKYKK